MKVIIPIKQVPETNNVKMFLDALAGVERKQAGIVITSNGGYPHLSSG
ncbi:hypothetical protein GM661_01410 [Iocasia frigidifontis]|uniref:Uncharacterized protein n=1 Tax=Iocasia fonsfrigidae TaxID=2682810 RepID=A0A8A7KEY8_9FIRM|nr:hypothetical protein [Iocasia fonsfrigidae]QTL96724.1 hypothetical protein GM661_01410 [Iocasia fonsfrigidae]